MNKPQETFAVRLLRLEAEAKMRSFELAKKANISTAVISQLENGRFNPSFQTLVKLAHTFNVSLDWLCCLTDERRPLRGAS